MEVFGSEVPDYAILSHVWRADEVGFERYTSSKVSTKLKYAKIDNCCLRAAADGISHVWIDTCCIDKRSSSELSEAINSMYRWYTRARVCYAYLDDVAPGDLGFDQSEWFERGWTLQELLAPSDVVFYNHDWQRIGTKVIMKERIALITRIERSALEGGRRLASFSVAQRLAWACHRRTTLIEDRAYSLMGLFKVNMPLLYGEGQEAFTRLQEEIIKRTDDHTIFAWDPHTQTPQGIWPLLAKSVDDFADCHDIIQFPDVSMPRVRRQPFQLTNMGIAIQLPFRLTPVKQETYIAALCCAILGRDGRPPQPFGIFLYSTHLAEDLLFTRVLVDGESMVQLDEADIFTKSLKIIVRQHNLGSHLPRNVQGFRIMSFDGGVESNLARRLHRRDEDQVEENIMAIAEGQTGTVGVVEFTAPSHPLGAVKFGLDSGSFPFIAFYARRPAQRMLRALNLEDHTWIDENLHLRAGAQPLDGFWWVVDRKTWYVGIDLADSSDGGSKLSKMRSPGEQSVELTFVIEELDLKVSLLRSMYREKKLWMVWIATRDPHPATYYMIKHAFEAEASQYMDIDPSNS